MRVKERPVYADASRAIAALPPPEDDVSTERWLDAAVTISEACREDARAWAEESLRVTGTLEEYDEASHFKPTPRDYREGSVAHTPNAVSTRNRHHRTNYDALCAELGASRSAPLVGVYYEALRDRVAELLGEPPDPE